MTLVNGKKYRVNIEGASLERMRPIGAWAWTNEVRRLALGEQILYDGARPGIGSDPITETHWVAADGTGGWNFSPGRWGWPRAGALVEVVEERTASTLVP